ncbi:MAG: DUF2510 domain-containing protein [Cellulomonas sp.]
MAGGWYDDGVTPGVERWFDGTEWSERTRAVWVAPVPIAPSPPAPSGYGAAPQSGFGQGSPYGQQQPGPGAGGAQQWPGQQWGPQWPAQQGPAVQGPAVQGPAVQWPAPQWPGPQWPAAPGSMAASGPTDAVHWMLPVGRSWQSITAGYVGLLALGIWVLGPVAIWLGIWAMQKARRGGHGRGRAIFAIVTGTLGTLFMAAFLVASSRS